MNTNSIFVCSARNQSCTSLRLVKRVNICSYGYDAWITIFQFCLARRCCKTLSMVQVMVTLAHQASHHSIFHTLYTGYSRANSFYFFINGYWVCIVFFSIFYARMICNTLCKKLNISIKASIPSTVNTTCSYNVFLLMFTGFASCITHLQMKWPLPSMFLWLWCFWGLGET